MKFAVLVASFLSFALLGHAHSAELGPTATQAKPSPVQLPKDLGTRTSGLKYYTIAPADFALLSSKKKTDRKLPKAKFYAAKAPIHLPDGAIIKEYSCFGEWGQLAKDEFIWLELQSHRDGKAWGLAGSMLKPNGTGRATATVNREMDNFANSATIRLNLQGKAVYGCRVGYEPPKG